MFGNGSDLVVADAGIRGLVIRNRARELVVDGLALRRRRRGRDGRSSFVARIAAGLAGIEFGISIPGSLGGAVWANAGAHGGEMRDVVTGVEAWDPRDGSLRQVAAADCAFAYRDSRFKHSPR